MTNFTNYMGRGSVDRPADGDVWTWDEESGFSKPVAAAGGGGAVAVADVTLDNADILALWSQAFEVIPPRAGYVAVPVNAVTMVLQAADGAYTYGGTGGHQNLFFDFASLPAMGLIWDSFTLMDVVGKGAADTYEIDVVSGQSNGTQGAGEAVVIHSEGSVDYGGGNAANKLRIVVPYIYLPVTVS